MNLRCDGKLIDRIDWDNIMPMSRYSGGHDEQMKGLLKDITVIAHWNEGDYQGCVATCVMLNDTKEVVIYNDYYGSCSGCDAWDDALDSEVIRMCKQLAGGALIFNNLKDCKKFLESKKDASQYNWSNICSTGLLEEIEKYKKKEVGK